MIFSDLKKSFRMDWVWVREERTKASMQYPDFLNDVDLTFIDIEATDRCKDRRLIQFSGFRFDHKTHKTQSIDVRVNPEQELSNQIINLLKTDNEALSQYPTLESVKNEIYDFVKGSVIISFGPFDYPFLKETLKSVGIELDEPQFDLQLFIKKYAKSEVALSNLHSLLNQTTDCKLQHDALYDASMLKDLYWEIQKLSDEQLLFYSNLSHVSPRIMIPRHEIFSKEDFTSHKWTNIPNDYVNPLIIKDLELDFFLTKDPLTKQKKKVYYLKKLEYYIQKPNQEVKEISFAYHSNVGQYTYQCFYKPDVAKFLQRMLDNSEHRSLFFLSVNKAKIQIFTEIIYDALNRYVVLNYINLNHIKKFIKPADPFLYFQDMIAQLPVTLQTKFKGFNTWKKSSLIKMTKAKE